MPTAPPCNALMKVLSGSLRRAPKLLRSTSGARRRPLQSTDSNWPIWMWTVPFSWHSHDLGGVPPLPHLPFLGCHNAPARTVPSERPHPRPFSCHRPLDRAAKFVRIDGTFRFWGGHVADYIRTLYRTSFPVILLTFIMSYYWNIEFRLILHASLSG